MRRVVYLLGAGFSAPLGLPLISNFYWKAKDLYERDRQKFAHFLESFSLMESFHRIRMFMKADLENIEEILSILEMKELLSSESESNRERFSKFICDVIQAYTPERTWTPVTARDYPDFSRFFGSNTIQSSYCVFVAHLFAVTSAQYVGDRWSFRRGAPTVHYSVVNLNYDNVLEEACNYINSHYPPDAPLKFHSPKGSGASPPETIPLAKLHGSVETEIVPPTWNKKIHKTILPAWQQAFRSVADANELRFIGYSLPDTDSYFRYFLKAAISQSFNLQKVDVLCSGNVQQRYADLFESNRLTFMPGKTENYLEHLVRLANGHFQPGAKLDPNAIEETHRRLFP